MFHVKSIENFLDLIKTKSEFENAIELTISSCFQSTEVKPIKGIRTVHIKGDEISPKIGELSYVL